MRRFDGDAYQREYFDVAEHQYPRTAVVMPPRHTELEGRNVLDRLAVARGDGPVIDFGAGTGRLSIALARAGYAVLAVDVSSGSLAVLRETALDLGLHAIETATVLPSAGRFAAIVGSDVLHHVDLDVQLPRIYFSGGRTLSAGGMTRWATGRCFDGSRIATSSKPANKGCPVLTTASSHRSGAAANAGNAD